MDDEYFKSIVNQDNVVRDTFDFEVCEQQKGKAGALKTLDCKFYCAISNWKLGFMIDGANIARDSKFMSGSKVFSMKPSSIKRNMEDLVKLSGKSKDKINKLMGDRRKSYNNIYVKIKAITSPI